MSTRSTKFMAHLSSGAEFVVKLLIKTGSGKAEAECLTETFSTP